MSAFVRSMTGLFRRRVHTYPLRFPSARPEIAKDEAILEEEQFEEFQRGSFYPINVGDILVEKYQVVGKLGYGSTSTVWLARDMLERRHVTLKIYTRGDALTEEFQIYKKISAASISHPGRAHVRTAPDLFSIQRSGGNHFCLVQRPMWDSLADLLERSSTHRFTLALLKAALSQIFLALDFLHTECGLVHTDIKADNIMQEIEDETILERFVEEELQNPSPRKIVNGAPIYVSRRFDIPKIFCKLVIGDLGEAVDGHQRRNHNAQPNVYRAPEVMLKADWSFPIDIWNVGVLIWDIFEGKHMFTGEDPDGEGYSTRAHLAEVISILGQAPLPLIQSGTRSIEFFDERGVWKADVKITEMSLQQSEQVLDGHEQAQFLQFMQGMLQWTPGSRRTASQLARDPWLSGR